ncbi:Yip1 domain-containing protein [Wuchereria bancrofti]|uniref:Protein YIPF3 n=1 Tax=Wuchereria bancrofti TaxID=6293 RepID=J9F7I8_WUCBA|nr:Yip1 domain-containing protein [Wuchereria bancrofti]
MESTRSRNRTNSIGSDTQATKDVLHAKLSQMVWEASSKQMKDTLNSYGRIDLFRPYFDVEPRQVRNRLIQSFIPRKPSQMHVSSDMYGPTMIILTLVALLLYSMKSSGYTVQDGTLIGTAMVTCFGAWFFMSLVIYALCLVFSVDISFIHFFSLYSLYLCSRTHDKSHKLAITMAAYVLHLSYLSYLHYGFHVVVEEIDEILGDVQQSSIVSLPLSD